MLNLHHLELFYYVAKAGGISRACAVIPYGVQQPAVSAQISRLEQSLGMPLFDRKPFRLTQAGERLFAEVAPFFEKCGNLESLLRGEYQHQLRVVALGDLLKEHLPGMFQTLKKRFPDFRARLYERNHEGAMEMLQSGDADLVVTVRETAVPRQFTSRDLIRLPMALLVPKRYPKNVRASDFWTGRIEAPLIALPGNEMLTRQFQAELLRQGASWPTAIEANSIDLIVEYVRHDMGVGLLAAAPGQKFPAGLRVLPLHDFPEIVISAFWRGELPAICRVFLELIGERASELSRE